MEPIKVKDIQIGDYIQAVVIISDDESYKRAWDKTIFQVKQIIGLELYSYLWADYLNGVVKIDKRKMLAHLQVDNYNRYRFYKLSEDEFTSLAGKQFIISILD